MATSVATTPGWGVSDGESINARQTRMATVSTFDLSGGASPLLNGYGVLPTLGNPLGVTQTATPGMRVTVIAGKITVPSNTAGEPGYSMVLEVNTDLDIAAAHPTNPRIDLVIARVIDTGTSSTTYTIEILTGTAAASPSRPTLPSGTSHCISIATVTVPALASSILNANVTRVESDTWSTATSDARYMAGPGGVVYKGGLITMSSTRRQAWAALYPPGTPWWDANNRVFGVSNGSDIVPLSVRTMYQVVDAADQQTTSTTPVQIATSGTLTAIGGTRRIRITMSGKFGCDGSADTRWMAGRVYLTGSGTLSLPGATQVHGRVWGAASAPETVSQHTFSATYTADVAAGTYSVAMALLRVQAGGTGTGNNIICTDGCLLVEDIGPA